MKFISFIILLFLSMTAYSAQTLKESSPLFSIQVDKLHKHDGIQFYGAFLSPDQTAKSTFSNFDMNRLVHVAKSSPAEGRIRKLFVSRSALLIYKDFDNDLKKKVSGISFFKKAFPNYGVTNCKEQNCDVSISFVLASVNFNLTYKFYDFSDANQLTEIKKLLGDKVIEGYDAASIQETRKFNSLFTHGDQVTFYKHLKPGVTLVVNHGIFLVKNSAYEKASAIPFFNLENSIQKRLLTELNQLRDYSNNSGSAGDRTPQSEYSPELSGLRPLVDPEGDQHLIKRSQTVPFNLAKAIAGKKKGTSQFIDWHTMDITAAEPPLLVDPTKPSIQGRENPIRREALVAALTQIIIEELNNGLTPKISEAPKWAPETIESSRGQAGTEIIFIPKFLAVLALGETHIYTPTGKDRDLQKWILQQGFYSITIPELFRASYKINDGDVFKALMTIQNLMAANWRVPGRENLPATKRLKPITSGYNYAEDRYGTWYHFFGMILFGLMEGSQSAHFVGFTESLGSKVLSPKVNKTQKKWMNVTGGYVGEDLRKVISEKSYLSLNSDPARLREDLYLNKNEDFRDRLDIPVANGLKAKTFKTGEDEARLEIQSTQRELKNCQMDVMFKLGAQLDSRTKIIFNSVSLTPKQTLKVGINTSNANALKGFIHSCDGFTPNESLAFEVPFIR